MFDIFESASTEKGKIQGVVVGIVTNNEDPEKLGRVKVMIPRISSEDESHWARVCSFMSGNDRGAFFLPEVDDEVLLAFEHGDINTPYVIGSLRNGKDSLPQENGEGTDDIRLIKSRSGHLIVMDDTDGSEKIEIKDGSGETMISFETGSKTITITSGQDISLAASKGKISLEAKEIEVKSSAGAKIEAGSTLDMKGTQINLN